jgi:hypothetical protein
MLFNTKNTILFRTSSGYALLNLSKRASHDCVATYRQYTNVRRMFWKQCLHVCIFTPRQGTVMKRNDIPCSLSTHQCSSTSVRYGVIMMNSNVPPTLRKRRLTRCSASSLGQGHTAFVKASLSERPSYIRSFREYSVFSTANDFAQLASAASNTRANKIPVSQRGWESKLHGDAQPPDSIFISYATGMTLSLKQNTLYLTSINPLNAEFNPIFHLLALLVAHHTVHISRIRVNMLYEINPLTKHSPSSQRHFIFSVFNRSQPKCKSGFTLRIRFITILGTIFPFKSLYYMLSIYTAKLCQNMPSNILV